MFVTGKPLQPSLMFAGSVVMLSAVMLSVIMLNAPMVSMIMLGLAFFYYGECH